MDILKRLGINNINPGACFQPTQWSESPSASALLTSINPATEQAIASVHPATLADYQQVIDSAHQAFLQWRQVPAPKRGEIIRQIGQALRQHKDDLGSLVSLEMGKIKAEGDGEVQEMIDMADFAVGQSRMLYGNAMHSERPHHRMYEQWHPLGVVGVISAFNFPVAVWSWNAFLAAIAGNTVIWKPSSKTPLCAIAVQHICNQVLNDNQLPGIFSLLISNESSVKEALINDPRIPLVSFTGSCYRGKQVSQAVASRMGRCLLELGGNNAIIVDQSAKLEIAIPAILFGAIGTSGQRCTSTRRLIVHKSQFDVLLESLQSAYQQIQIGDPLAPRTLMGPLIDHNAVKDYSHAIQAVQQAGGQISYGGEVIQHQGFFVQPSLVLADSQWPIVQQETFAPILYIQSFSELEEAIAIQNSVPQGLSSAIFTQDLQRAEFFLSYKGSDCGIANVNIGTSGAEIGGAFGGEKETGGGREAGSDAWKTYMRRQTNTINWGNDLPLAQGIDFKI